ncbi:MAG: CPBP family intramembrane metalloprotease [Intestinibacter sp.]|uniref:CPBP family intramembrane glutamic endopeptidase n=1 Tax=Intestinibacter sp. TaxID=1965304 RepID=UPI0025BFB128|nr:CPBP family intramembrane glutamic endopeptidase [Intestinibacter sp.]MCI6737083.1 CPBP family intramembrane metalloprotease [Intestinibacter sp.]
MSNKENKTWLPNECSKFRWIITAVVGYLLGHVFAVPWIICVEFLPIFTEGSFFAPVAEIFNILGSFCLMFLGIVLAIKWIAKTSIHDFILGSNGSVNKKQTATILALYALGIMISTILSIGQIHLRNISINIFIINFVICLLLVWAQTSFEEFVFRGFFIRFICKDEIKMSVGTVIAGIVSSLIFMSLHLSNPEVLAQADIQVYFAAASYFLAGASMFFVDIYFKSLAPGLAIHWLNNFLAFVFISSDISVGASPSLFVDTSELTGILMLLQVVLAYLPLYLYIAYKTFKKKQQSL